MNVTKFPKPYTIKNLDEDLKKNTKFSFKGKNILILLFILPSVFVIAIGIILIFLGLLLIAIGVITFITLGSGLSTLYMMKRTIQVDQEGIRWSSIFSSNYIKFIDIEEVTFFPSVFTNLETIKLFLYNKMKFRIRTNMMTSPKKWDSEEVIRKIIEYYWPKANPDAKHARKSVAVTPSATSAKISLVKPRKDEIDSLKGYKCPNCLLIHDEKHEFCPKCGAKME